MLLGSLLPAGIASLCEDRGRCRIRRARDFDGDGYQRIDLGIAPGAGPTGDDSAASARNESFVLTNDWFRSSLIS